jgi:hypothetical protein
MRRLAQAPNRAIATLWVHALREEGVEATVQREFLGAVVGQLPPDQCLPEIWIDDETQFDSAKRLLQALQNRPQRRWHCRCGELVEGGFEQCWQCGQMMPSA